MLASSPAPRSTTTSKPASASFFTESGTSATRRSPGLTSLGTPTFIEKGGATPIRRDRRLLGRETLPEGADQGLKRPQVGRFRPLAGLPAARLRPPMPTFVHAGQRLSYEVHGEGPRSVVLLPGLLFSEPHARAACARPRRPRQPGDHARPARARRVGQAAGHVALLDPDLRAARSSRCSTTSSSTRR